MNKIKNILKILIIFTIVTIISIYLELQGINLTAYLAGFVAGLLLYDLKNDM